MTGPDRIVPLFSSSSGNSTLIKSRGMYILVDCGMSCKMMTKALVEAGVYPDDISAVFLTHRHSDHIGGMAEVLRKTGGMTEEVIAKVSSEIAVGVPIKELLLIQEMARSDSENGVITYEKYMDCFHSVHPDM